MLSRKMPGLPWTGVVSEWAGGPQEWAQLTSPGFLTTSMSHFFADDHTKRQNQSMLKLNW